MAAIGLFAIAVIWLLPAASDNPLARWILTDTLAPARVLPLIGLGAVFGLAGTSVGGAALALFALGIAGGFVGENPLLRLLDRMPQAATHLFLTGPISYLAVGVTLVAGAKPRAWLAPLAALIFGAMMAFIIKMTDPTLHEPAYTWTPVLIACWIIAAVSLTLRAFPQNWLTIFGRIFGSWLLAIGLLYGGASLLPKRTSLPPLGEPALPERAPAFNRALPPLPGRQLSEPAPFPEGDRQP